MSVTSDVPKAIEAFLESLELIPMRRAVSATRFEPVSFTILTAIVLSDLAKASLIDTSPRYLRS